MTDLIDEWVHSISPYIDAPFPFIEATGYHLVSDLLGRFFNCASMPNGRPNLWILISSIPGRARRSSLQGLAEKVTHSSLLQYYQAIKLTPKFREQKRQEKFDALTEDAKKEEVTKYRNRVIAQTSIEEGTPEGIGDAVSTRPYKEFRIVSTEMSGVFRRMDRPQNTGVEALLSKLYYGEGGSSLLSGRSGPPKERIIPRGLYVTMLAGMQQPQECLTIGMIKQGLLRRMMISYVEDFDRWLPPLNLERFIVTGLCERMASKITNIMLAVVEKMSSEPFDIMFHPTVYDKVNLFARKLDEEITSDPSLPNIYKQSLWEHLAKLSLNRTIAGLTVDGIQNEGLHDLLVSPKDFEEASKFLKPLMDKADDIVDSLKPPEDRILPRTTDAERVLRYITSGGREGILRSALSKRMGSPDPAKLQSMTNTLILEGRVRGEQQAGKKGGGVRFYAV